MAESVREHVWSAEQGEAGNTWVGTCSCGWKGETRYHVDDALREAGLHVTGALGWTPDWSDGETLKAEIHVILRELDVSNPVATLQQIGNTVGFYVASSPDSRSDGGASEMGRVLADLNELTRGLDWGQATTIRDFIENLAAERDAADEALRTTVDRWKRGNAALRTRVEVAQAELDEEKLMSKQVVQSLRHLRFHWRTIIDEQDDDGGPLIENLLCSAIDDLGGDPL